MSLTVSKYEVLELLEYCWKFYYHEEPARVAFLKSGQSLLRNALRCTQCSIICLPNFLLIYFCDLQES